MQYDELLKRYKPVRSINGGGTRDMSFPCSATKTDVLSRTIELFLSEEDKLTMDIELGNFKCEPVTENLMNKPFTVENYYQTFKLNRARFYLLTRKLTSTSIYDESSSDDDEVLLKSPFSVNEGERNRNVSQLIGTTDDRASLKEEQDKAYMESLKLDRVKAQASKESINQEKDEKYLEKSFEKGQNPQRALS